MSTWMNPQKPYTGDGKTTRDIYGGKTDTDRNGLRGLLQVVYRTKDGKSAK